MIMNYFKILGIVFGLAAFLKPFYMHLLPWDENSFIEKFYSEKRPPYIVIIALLGLVLIALTWYLHFSLDIANSIYLTVLFSLTAIKALVLLLDYQKFQRAVAAMLRKDRGRGVVLVDIGASVIGLVILVITFILY
jgi:small-conductance mechanosensitive channel